MSGTSYTVHLRATVEHRRGPEPEWEPVAEATRKQLDGQRIGFLVGDDVAHLQVTAAEVDTAADPETEGA